MTDTPRTLLQFPISHYCEKTRWNLDAKGLSYAVRNVPPGLHILLLRRYGTRTVPVLVDGAVSVADSTDIALYLERTYPAGPLLPAGGELRERVLELEEHFDEVGRSLRGLCYTILLRRPGAAGELLFAEYRGVKRLLGRLATPIVELGIRKRYGISDSLIAPSLQRVEEALDRLERETGGDPARYLVGESLTIADITAASMLAPLVGPAGTPWTWPLPAEAGELRERVRSRLAGQWVLERYRRDRAPGAGSRLAAAAA